MILVAVARGDRLFVYLLEHLRRPPVGALSAHALYLEALADVVICHGALRDGDGGVVCVHADNASAAEAIALGDPLVAFGFHALSTTRSRSDRAATGADSGIRSAVSTVNLRPM